MMKQTILAVAVCALAGYAAPQQTATAITPSPTGCYYRAPGVALYGGIPLRQSHYEPAPCNVINANMPLSPLAPIVVEQGGSSAASPVPRATPELQVPDASVSLPALPRPQTQFCFGSGAFQQCQ
jgi:hypothetical protein